MAQLQRLAITAEQCVAQTITLTAPQQHYLHRVLRLKGGDRFIAILDSGQWWLTELEATLTHAHCIAPIPLQTELTQPLTLLAAIPKGQGFEDVVRAATELGVTTLVPLLTARTVMQPSAQKLERWRRIATEAAEQSHRQVIPTLLPPTSFTEALRLAQGDLFRCHQPLICVIHPKGKNLTQTLVNSPKMGILVMVGPEGGWTDDEEAMAIAAGFIPVSLGRRVLRAVTASLAAVAILSTTMEVGVMPPQDPSEEIIDDA